MSSNFVPTNEGIFQQAIEINNTTPATSTSASLMLNGGLTIFSTQNALNFNSGGALLILGGSAIQGNTIIGGITQLLNTSIATNISTGALQISGGLSVQGSAFINVGNFNYLQSSISASISNLITSNISTNSLSISSINSQNLSTSNLVVNNISTNTLYINTSSSNSIPTIFGYNSNNNTVASGLSFSYWNGSSFIEKARFDSVGNFLINSTQANIINKMLYVNCLSTAGSDGAVFDTQNIISPVVGFSIQGSRKYTIGIDSDDSNKFKFNRGLFTAQVNTMTLDQLGNVGIGTTAPSSSLQVIGDTNISGNLTIGTALITSLASIGTLLSTNLTVGSAIFTCTTNSSNKLNGAVIINGGLGIANNTNIGGNLRIAGIDTSLNINSTNLSIISNSSLIVSGGGNFTGVIYANNFFQGTTAASIALTPSPLISQGDLYTYSCIGSTNLPVGSYGQVLTANTLANTGLQWISPVNLVGAYGSECYYSNSKNNSGTTSTIGTLKTSLSTASLIGGAYKIEINYSLSPNTSITQDSEIAVYMNINSLAGFNIGITTSNLIHDCIFRPSQLTNLTPFCTSVIQTFGNTTTQTVGLYFRNKVTGEATYLSNSSLLFYKISNYISPPISSNSPTLVYLASATPYCAACKGALAIAGNAIFTGNIVTTGAYSTGDTSTVQGNVDAVGAITMGANSNYTGTMICQAAITTGASETFTGDIYSLAVVTAAALTRIIGNVYACTSYAAGAGSSVSGVILKGKDSRVVPNSNNITVLNDVTNAYNILLSLSGLDFLSSISNNKIYTGIYTTIAALSIPAGTNIIFDGSSTDKWIIQINGAMSFAGNIALANGALGSNIQWVSSGAFAIAGNSIFYGTIVSSSAVSMAAGSKLYGAAFSTLSTVSLLDGVTMTKT